MEGIREQDEGHAADVTEEQGERESIPFENDDAAKEDEDAKWFDPEPDQSLADLEEQLAAVSAANQTQTRELKMYTEWLSSHKESLNLDESAKAAATTKSQNSSRKSSRRGKSRASNRGGGATARSGGVWSQTLTSLEKCTISNKEFEQVQQVQGRALADWEHTLGVLSAEIEERKEAEEGIEISTEDALKELAKLEMAKHNLDTGPKVQLTSLRIHRAHEETLKAMVGQVGKLMLKVSSAKSRMRKVKATLKAKEEGGEDLRKVDYDKLKIQNQEFVEALEKKNKELHKYKIQTSSLSHKADALHDRIRESCSISDKLTKQTNAILHHKHRGETEYLGILQEQKETKVIIEVSKKKLAKNRVPSVLSYVGMGAEMAEVKRQIHLWSQHGKTAAVGAKRAKREWRKQRQTHGAVSAPSRYRRNPEALGGLRSARPLVVPGVASPASMAGGWNGYGQSPRSEEAPRSLSAKSSLDRRPPGGMQTLPIALPPIY